MKVLRFLDNYFEEALASLLLLAMTAVVACQIALRMAGIPLAWSEEAARYMFIWLIYIGAAYAIKKRSHIKVELISLVVKEKGQFILDMIADICFMVFAVFLTIYGWDAVYRVVSIHQQSSPAMHINMGVPYSAVAAGCSLMVIRLVQDIILRVSEYRDHLRNANRIPGEGEVK